MTCVPNGILDTFWVDWLTLIIFTERTGKSRTSAEARVDHKWEEATSLATNLSVGIQFGVAVGQVLGGLCGT